VVDVRAQVHRPGGAALAALIAAVDGHDVVLVTALGDDDAGARVRALLAGRVRVVGVPLDGPTPEKIRVRVAGRSLVRLDRGGAPAPVGTPGADALATIAGAGAVLVSDYGRGVTAEPAIRRALSAVAARRPVVWDPHPRGREPVPGVRLVTPNAREAAALSGLPGDGLPGVTAAADHLRGRWEATAVAVTLGPRGALLMLGEREPLVVPAPVLGEAVDTCGAGDAFAAAAASALAAGEVLSEAVAGAVRRASAFVAAGGAAAVGPGTGPAAVPHRGGTAADVVARVRAAGGTVVATGGCFDLLHPGHVATLQAARGLGDCLIVCMNSDASVRRLKGPDRPICPEEDRARVLAAFSAVDAVVVFDEDTPERVLAELRPDIWVKGGDYAGVHVPEADLVRGWGGQAVVVPYLDGRSSTRLVAAARGTIR
jgi:rfaE bifunctional protein nucleotidyltransferase chain/domain